MKVWLFALIIGGLCPLIANASPIQVNASGTIGVVETGLGPFFTVGDTVNFNFVYETTTPESFGSSLTPLAGDYLGAASDLNGQIGSSFTFMSTPSATSVVSVTNSLGDGARVNFGGTGGLTGSPVGTWSPFAFSFLISALNTTLATDALSATLFSDLANAAGAVPQANLTFGSSLGGFGRNLHINYGTGGITSQPFNPGGPAVPEPSTMLLLGSGLVGLVGWQYRKKHLA